MSSINTILSTGVSGLNAFNQQLGVIAQNIANVGTAGFKVVDQNFEADNLGNSVAGPNGIVTTQPLDLVADQGALAPSQSSTALAISGNGMFAVTVPLVSDTGVPNFTNAAVQYTREGDFKIDSNGYLVNANGQYLMGLAAVNGTLPATVSTAALTPINISQTSAVPGIASTSASLVANLNTANSPLPFNLSIYDSAGAQHTIPLVATSVGPNTWQIAAAQTLPAGIASVSATNNTVSFNADGTLSPSAAGAGNPVSVNLAITYAGGTTQNVVLGLGTAASSSAIGAVNYVAGSGTTAFDGAPGTISSITADGVAANTGTRDNVVISNQGTVTEEFTNGAALTTYQIPIYTFANPNGLSSVDGTLFAANPSVAGAAVGNLPGSNGAGTLLAGELESSTVSLPAQFTTMIAAQRSYEANAKIVTVADQMSQTLVAEKV